MLMAAGLGTRLRPFTETCPKPLLPLLGVPMAQFCVDALERAGVERIVANVHHLPQIAAEGLRALDRRYASLAISDESDKLLGSAGGIRKALPLLGDGPFFLVNGDVLTAVNLELLGRRHLQLKQQHGVSLTMTIFPSGPRGQAYRQIFVNYRQGLIRGFGELAVDKPFFAGVAVIEPEAVAHLPEGEPADFVRDVLEPAIKAGRAGAYLANAPWYDIGSPALWFEAHWDLMEGLEKNTMPPAWRGRIENNVRKISPTGLVARSSPAVLDVSRWQAPYFWSRQTIPGIETQVIPPELGPRTVLYGAGPASGLRPSNGIGFQGLWCDIAPPSA
jgi:NDP-sugar pyrophosphorylase family protein